MNDAIPKVDFSKGVGQYSDQYPKTKYQFTLTARGKWGLITHRIYPTLTPQVYLSNNCSNLVANINTNVPFFDFKCHIIALIHWIIISYCKKILLINLINGMKKVNILDEITSDFNQLSSSNNYSSKTIENENYFNDQYTGLANRLDLFEKTDYKYDLSPQPQDSYEEILEKYLVGHNEEIIEQEAALELYSELTGNESTIGTFGNISVIKGRLNPERHS